MRHGILYLGLGFAVSGEIGAGAYPGDGPRELNFNVPQISLSRQSFAFTEAVGPAADDAVQAIPNRDLGYAEGRGNPLWAIPLGILSATRERPVFSSSRRAPVQAVAVPPAPEPVRPPPASLPPEVPPLTLVGAVVNGDQGIAIFIDQSTRNIVRLKVGEAHFGWVLRRVRGRETVLENDRQTVVLKLPLPGEVQLSILPEPTAFTGSGVLPGLAPVPPALRNQPREPISIAPPVADGKIPGGSGRVPGL